MIIFWNPSPPLPWHMIMILFTTSPACWLTMIGAQHVHWRMGEIVIIWKASYMDSAPLTGGCYLQPTTCVCSGLGIACTSQSLFSTTQISNCHSNDTCIMILQVSLLMQICEACQQASDPLELACCYLEQDRFSDQACTTCCGYIQKELRVVWNKLPKYFGLQWNAPVLCNCVLHVWLIFLLLLIAVVVFGQNVQIASCLWTW